MSKVLPMLKDLKALKDRCDDAYYNSGEEILLDSEYDELVDRIKKAENTEETVGATPTNHAVTLPYWMGSLDKIKTQEELDRWLSSKGDISTFCITPKLDGVSCLLVIKDSKIKLYTRGNGKVGSDITPLAPFIKGIRGKGPQALFNLAVHNEKGGKGLAVFRGELVMSKKMFESKYKSQFSNARNLVSGAVNSLQTETAKDVNFVPYEIIELGGINGSEKAPVAQHCLMGEILWYNVVERKKLNIEYLNTKLKYLKENYDYEIDGLVVQINEKYTRNTSKNPTYTKAFKGETESAETLVEYVEWNVSKRGCLKPRVKVETVHLSGVDINFATGFNAKFISDNNVGKGSMVLITRSGDVIPFIKEVLIPTQADMPTVPFVWDENKVDIYINEMNPLENTIAFVEKMPEEQAIRLIEAFFKALEVKNMGIGTVKKLYKAGYRTVKQIYEGSIEDFTKLDSFQEKSATRLYESIHSQKPELSTLLGAFGIPNLGQRKAQLILDHIPNLVDLKNLDSVKPLKGVPTETLEEIIKYMPSFKEFVSSITFKKAETPVKKKTKPVPTNPKSDFKQGSIFVFTGFRDKELERKLKNIGYDVKSAVSGKTTAVIRGTEDHTTKVQAAEKLGIPVYTKEEFLRLIQA